MVGILRQRAWLLLIYIYIFSYIYAHGASRATTLAVRRRRAAVWRPTLRHYNIYLYIQIHTRSHACITYIYIYIHIYLLRRQRRLVKRVTARAWRHMYMYLYIYMIFWSSQTEIETAYVCVCVRARALFISVYRFDLQRRLIDATVVAVESESWGHVVWNEKKNGYYYYLTKTNTGWLINRCQMSVVCSFLAHAVYLCNISYIHIRCIQCYYSIVYNIYKYTIHILF